MRNRTIVLAACAAALLAGPRARAGLFFQPASSPGGADVRALAPDGATLWAATYRGVWKLSAGAWTLDGLGDREVASVAVSGGYVWAATGDALYRRGADGTWSAEALPGSGAQVSLLAAQGDVLYAGGMPASAGGPVLFRRSGGSWAALTPPASGFPTALAADSSSLVVGLSSGVVSRYASGAFAQVGGAIGLNETVTALLPVGTAIYAGTPRGLWVWNGGAWMADAGFGLHDVRALTAAGGPVRAATYDAGVLRNPGSGWTPERTGLLTYRTSAFAALASDVYLGTAGGPVYRLSGSSWSAVSPATLQGAIVTDVRASLSSLSAAPVFVAARGAGIEGTSVPDGCGDVTALATTATATELVAASGCGPLDGFAALAPASSGLPDGALVTTLAETMNGTAGGTSNAGIWRLVGSTWSPDNAGLSDTAAVDALREVGLTLYASVNGRVLTRAGNGTWIDTTDGLPPGSLVTTFAGNGGVFAGLAFGGVWRRDPDGPWRQDSAGLLSHAVASLDTAGGRLTAAAGTAGVLVRADGGFRPETYGLPAGADVRVVRGVTVTPYAATAREMLYAGTAGRGAFVADPVPSSRTVPVVLDVVGGTGARFRSELVIGSSVLPANVTVAFHPAPGFGAPAVPTGSASFTLAHELRIADALEWLRSLGMSIPPAGATPIAGSLTLSASMPGVPGHAPTPLTGSLYAIARTYTSAGSGSFGLFYDAPTDVDAAEESASVYALRSVAGSARSNLALVHVPGRSAEAITLSVQVYDASGHAAGEPMMRTLAPGEWTQINGVLDAAGLPDGSFGWATITRTAGSGPWIAYGVVNDAATSDGSYLAMQRPGGLGAARRQIVPVVLDVFGAAGSHYTTELTLVNDGPVATPVDLTYRPAPGFSGFAATITVSLAAHEQRTLADVLQTFRDKGASIPRGDQGGTAGTLSVEFRYLTNLDVGTTLAFARTTTPNTAGSGSFGLFYPAVARGGGARTSAVVPALRQDASARSNLAVVHVRGGSDQALTLSVRLYDADTGAAVGSALSATLQPGEWKQWSSVAALAGVPASTTRFYAVVTRTGGDDTFFAYGVQNDAVTSDGSYVAMIPGGLVLAGMPPGTPLRR